MWHNVKLLSPKRQRGLLKTSRVIRGKLYVWPKTRLLKYPTSVEPSFWNWPLIVRHCGAMMLGRATRDAGNTRNNITEGHSSRAVEMDDDTIKCKDWLDLTGFQVGCTVRRGRDEKAEI